MEKKENKKSFFAKKEFRKVYVMVGISAIALISMVVLLNRVSATGQEIHEIKKEGPSAADEATIAFLKEESNHLAPQIQELRDLFATQSEIVQFVSETSRLSREGLIQSVSFVTDNPIKDQTGNLGYPVSFTIRGSEEQVDASLRNIQSLPFLLRGVQTTISKETVEDGSEIISLQYGGFLYVDPSVQ